ncbi:MAG: hypothetical protein CK531_01710 [Gemmatimonadetes bacterium]|nr:MAG: hypothetical protein CK531_01710 [Gemmatimonadota bacterium]
MTRKVTEGLIIRLDSGLIYTLKPSVSIDAAIIAYTVKSDQADMARSIPLGLMHEDGQFQVLGRCGGPSIRVLASTLLIDGLKQLGQAYTT